MNEKLLRVIVVIAVVVIAKEVDEIINKKEISSK